MTMTPDTPATPPQPPAAPESPQPASAQPAAATPATGTGTGLNVTAWSPGEDVIEVMRTPAPGPARSVWRTFAETARGLATTFGRLTEKGVTVQYPEEKTPVYPRFRGRHKLHRFEDTGLEKCVGCSLCAAACPADCIRVVAAENTPENRVSAGERYAAVYEINLSRCIFCGYCEIACPFDAITMGHDYELSDYDRTDLIFTKEMLLAEPLERTPLRNEGE
jgi:NADH-quinone oxidoreductase subunit I